MSLRKDFLWGGAVAAHQIEGGFKEGGKGISIADVMTAGDNVTKKPRIITDGVLPGENYPNHYLQRWDLNALELQLLGLEYFLNVMSLSLTKRVLNFMTIYSMSA